MADSTRKLRWQHWLNTSKMSDTVEGDTDGRMDLAKNGPVERSDGSMFREDYEALYDSCFVCNGYYGPCFGEPICATCHAFLFPENQLCAHLVFSSILEEYESEDDSDSGNDEPSDPFNGLDKSDKPLHRAQPCRSKKARSIKKVDLLTQRINYLTTPRKFDDVSPGTVQCLPDDVLFIVFSYLDDLSLCCVGNVCKRWRNLLKTQVSDETWRDFTLKKWPLFKPLIAVGNWFEQYTKLVESSPCRTCLQNTLTQCHVPGDLDSWRNVRLRYELKSVQTDPLEGIQITPLDIAYFHWQGTIIGPTGSPYEGGLFFLHIEVPYGYPLCPPVVRFLTKIFHPNVSRHGDVAVDSLAHNWSLALTITKVMISVQSLLTDPYCTVCMEPEIGALYLKDRSTYDSIARTWTWKYAMLDVLK